MAAPTTPQPRLPHGAPALLLLLTALATALACRHLPPRHDAFSWHSLQLLQAMAPSPPQPCQHHAPFFPDILISTSHPHQAATAALRILRHLLATLTSPSTPQHWDAQAQHRLLNNLQHHILQLQQCLPGSGTLSQGQGPRNLLLNIHKYFARIHHFLHTHNHSACAWDHVRLEALVCFQHVDTLIRRVKSHAAPAPHPTPSPSQHQQPQAEQSPHQPGLGSLSTAHTPSSQQPVPTGTWA